MYDKNVWRALLNDMPMTAMLRNIRNMTKADVLTPMSDESNYVCSRLSDQEELAKARIHPLSILAALIAYDGKNFNRDNYYTEDSRSSGYTPVQQVVDALNDAYYLAFKNVEPTGKRYLLGVDVSGSMTWGNIASIPGMTPNVGAAAMAMAIARVEKNYHVMGFCHKFVDLGISKSDSLKDVIRKTKQQSFGGTDCSLPMLWALDNNVKVDAFITLTDSETWYGSMHPHEALKKYNSKMNRNAKNIVVGMVANNFTIADKNDVNSLDVAGFDTATPQLINDFVSGKI